MEAKEQKNPGPLKYSIEIELNTKEAAALFYGRKKTEDNSAIVGLKDFAQKIKYINNASHNDDPYADYFLCKIESSLKEVKQFLIDKQAKLEDLNSGSLLSVNQGSSITPVVLETKFASVYANIALNHLKLADNLLLSLYAMKHTGLMTREVTNNEVNKVNKTMRRAFLSADGYKFFNINRKDVEQQTARYRQAHVAMKFTSELPPEILDKTGRAEHAPNIALDPNVVFRKKTASTTSGADPIATDDKTNTKTKKITPKKQENDK